MAEPPFPVPDPSRRVGSPSTERAELDARLARLAARRAGQADAAGPRSDGADNVRTTGRRRRHPAARARVAALGLSIASTAGLAAAFAAGRSSATGAVSAAEVVRSSDTQQGATQVPAETASAGSEVASQSSEATSTTVVDGAVFHNRWGDVQVEATFDARGALVDVVALQTPDSRDKSVRINEFAIPRLTAEALAAQTASIDSISGATYTSADYSRSLQSAIDAARADGATDLA